MQNKGAFDAVTVLHFGPTLGFSIRQVLHCNTGLLKWDGQLRAYLAPTAATSCEMFSVCKLSSGNVGEQGCCFTTCNGLMLLQTTLACLLSPAVDLSRWILWVSCCRCCHIAETVASARMIPRWLVFLMHGRPPRINAAVELVGR